MTETLNEKLKETEKRLAAMSLAGRPIGPQMAALYGGDLQRPPSNVTTIMDRLQRLEDEMQKMMEGVRNMAAGTDHRFQILFNTLGIPMP